MRFNIIEYSGEISDFLSVRTLEEIDYGILDLSAVRNVELREVLQFFGELLRMELKINYLENHTGLFRVEIIGNKYYYNEFGYVIEADSIKELKQSVLDENRIWYVFDDILVEKII